MNTKYEDIIVGGLVLAFTAIVVLQVYILNNQIIHGDMNNDGVLSIEDLSILAVKINEQR